jgi:hypothetical protein
VERLPMLFGMTTRVAATPNGRLTLTLGGRVVEFAPVDSLTFREVDGTRMIAFGKGAGGNVTHMFAPAEAFGAAMPGAYERLPWYDDPYFKNEYMSFLLAVPIVVLFALWPLASIGTWWWRRRRDETAPGEHQAGGWLALGIAGGFFGLFAVFGFGFIARSVRMLQASSGIVYGMTGDMRLLAMIPYVLVPLGFAVLALTWRAWHYRYWGIVRRAYYSSLALGVVLVLAFLVRWNYLPPRW